MSKSKNVYAIIRIKTGKLITESETLPIFWNKKNAEYRAKKFIGVKVAPISEFQLITLLNSDTNAKD